MTLDLHPLCSLFPRMAGAEFAALVADIKANGLREPITLHGGMILDGGNRYAACVAAGVEPEFEDFAGGNIVSFVLSANLHRRHMSPGQQAAIVASAQDWAKAQTHGGSRRGDQVATLPLETIKGRAAESGASERTQRMADKVAKADPALAKKVAHGEVSLPAAAQAVAGAPKKAPPKTQPEPPAENTEMPSTAELLDDLQRDVERLSRENKALSATDGKAELAKQIGIREHLERQVADEMTKNATLVKQRDLYMRWLRRCGKAVGVDDLDSIAPAVEAMAREHRPTAKRVAA